MRGRHAALDLGIALVVAALGQVDAWGPSIAGAHISGPRAAVSAFYAVTAVALVRRRHSPLAVFVLIAVVDVVQFASIGASAGNGTLLPALVAGYSVGAYGDVPRSIAGGAPAIVIGVGHELANPNLPTGSSIVRATAWNLSILGAWLLGAFLRTRRLYVAELRERAVRAEHEREQLAAEAVAHERRRIAHELHDAVAHGVSVMVVQAEAAEEVVDGDAVAAKRALREVQRVGRESLVELRRLVGILRDGDGEAARTPDPGLARLQQLVDQVQEAGLVVEVIVDGTPRPLPAGVDLSAYRIVQEALTNVLKHAAAPRAAVRLDYGAAALRLEVSDEGRGAVAQDGGGHGLAGMRERVALYGGELEAHNRPTGGFVVRATLPVPTTS